MITRLLYTLSAKPIVIWNMVASYLQIYRAFWYPKEWKNAVFIINYRWKHQHKCYDIAAYRPTDFKCEITFFTYKKRPSSGGPVARSYIYSKIAQRWVMIYKKDL